MKGLVKSIEVFSEAKYGSLPYGTVYYVAGTATPGLNTHVLSHVEYLEYVLNHDGHNWVTCQVVYLPADNPYFPSAEDPALYSAMMPEDDVFGDARDSTFLVARLVGCNATLVREAFSVFFNTLQHMFDDVLDRGSYDPYHLDPVYLVGNEERCIPACLSAAEDGEGSPAGGIRFSVSGSRHDDFAPSSEYQGERRYYTLNAPDEAPCMMEAEPACASSPARPSRLVITENTYHLLLPDYGREIRFTTQVKALYILFLNHPEGIRMKEFEDYKDEYKHIYLRLTTWSDKERLQDAVERLLDVCNPQALHVKKSQCDGELRRAIPESHLRDYYRIWVYRGEPHRINLDRSLVSMPETLRP